MFKRVTLLLLVVGLTAVVGCNKKKQDTKEAAAATKKDEASADKPAEDKKAANKDEAAPAKPAAGGAAVVDGTPFAKYGLAEAAQKWQGTWVVPVGFGMKFAWKVDGDKLTASNGKKDQSLGFGVLAPCELKTTKKQNGGSSSTMIAFARGDSKTYAGLGKAGVLTDDGAVVCAGNKIYEVDKTGCSQWQEKFGKWKKSKGDCSLKDGTFQAGSTKLTKVDGVLLDAQMKKNVVKSTDSFEKAKAAVSK